MCLSWRSHRHPLLFCRRGVFVFNWPTATNPSPNFNSYLTLGSATQVNGIAVYSYNPTIVAIQMVRICCSCAVNTGAVWSVSCFLTLCLTLLQFPSPFCKQADQVGMFTVLANGKVGAAAWSGVVSGGSVSGFLASNILCIPNSNLVYVSTSAGVFAYSFQSPPASYALTRKSSQDLTLSGPVAAATMPVWGACKNSSFASICAASWIYV